jgi:hypothetical protein
MNICLLEPYYGGSHRRWVDGLRAHSGHKIDLLTLPARNWKWRMHGAAVTFARRMLSSKNEYDLVLANDMMDVAAFRGILQSGGYACPLATYFHENQLTYPVSPRDGFRKARRDLHFEYINYLSALVSDRLFFNSDFHRRSFLEALEKLLSTFPDFRNEETLEGIASRASTLHLGMDLRSLGPPGARAERPENRVPLLLWNHRWEYDKRPEGFLDLLVGLRDRGIAFEVAMLGPRGRNAEPLLQRAREELGTRIRTDEPPADGPEYAAWLREADILPVTSIQDFFGGSVVEAAYCGCHPLLPRRLAYPELFAETAYWYDTDDTALDALCGLIRSGRWRRPFTGAADLARFDWKSCIGDYDRALSTA